MTMLRQEAMMRLVAMDEDDYVETGGDGEARGDGDNQSQTTAAVVAPTRRLQRLTIMRLMIVNICLTYRCHQDAL